MVKSLGEASYSDELPEFFKVYMAALWSERLRIPPAFVKNFGGKIPRKVMLETSSNLFWEVRINKINDDLFFEEDWPEFVQENSLAHGEFLTFSYAGDSKFYVKIFAIDCCKKRVVLPQGNEASRPGKSYSIEAPQNVLGRALAVRKSRPFQQSHSLLTFLRVDLHACGKAMVKSLGEASYSNELPEFFNVYMAALWSERLRIPLAFVKNFGGKIPRKVMLVTSSNLFWEVRINKINDDLFFEEGWPEFVQENSLAHGEFLTFSYADDSKFYVKIFAIDCCKKGGVAPHSIIKHSIIKKEPVDLPQGNEASRPGKSYSTEAPRRNLHRRGLAVRKSRDKCPSFEMVMTKSYIRIGHLNIPAHFNIYWKKNGERTATLQHKDKSWRVVVATSKNRSRFALGWREFVNENSLKYGNVCSFKLIDRNDLVFKVSISR